MLVFKCLQGFSPQHLHDLPVVARKIPSDKYNLRDNEDLFLLENMCKCRTVVAECMFSCLSSQVWNALPLCIREIDNLQTFKCKLKCHYFELAFCDVPYRMFKVCACVFLSPVILILLLTEISVMTWLWTM